jgi:4-amino-4-deoxy-L-arabinose transferase-like glycosyltransferase
LSSLLPLVPPIFVIGLPLVVAALSFRPSRWSPGIELAIGLVAAIIWPFMVLTAIENAHYIPEDALIFLNFAGGVALWTCLHRLVSRLTGPVAWMLHILVAAPVLLLIGVVLLFNAGTGGQH